MSATRLPAPPVDRAKGADDLLAFTRILEGSRDGDMQWPRLAAVISEMVSAQCCWILLREDDEAGAAVVHGYGCQGLLSAVALRNLLRGVALAGTAMVSVPICVADARIGTIHVRSEKTGFALSERQVDTLSLAALLIGKSLHLSRMQQILKSRFAQLALMQGSAGGRMQLVREVVKHPMGVGRLVAKSFYREMTNAGLCSNEIIAIASEIISQLSASLRSRTQS